MSTEPINLQSISLILDEAPIFKGPSVSSLLPISPLPYKIQNLDKNWEVASYQLSQMPEVFQRRLVAFSKSEFLSANHIYRMVEMLRYNFSNGAQISAKDILRHPYCEYVPEDYLPQLNSWSLHFGPQTLAKWPLIQNLNSPESDTVEQIIQNLLCRVTIAHRQKKLNLFLQTHGHSSKSLQINSIEFDPGQELYWRVDFEERKSLKTNFKLVSDRRQSFYFFESYAIQPESGLIVVHPWLTEISQLKERLAQISEDLLIGVSSGMPTIEMPEEESARTLIQFLRTRQIPVRLPGVSHRLSADESQMEIDFDDLGNFTFCQTANVPNQNKIIRYGWTQKSNLYLVTLSQGLASLLKSTIKDIASQDSDQRKWDLALLKHLGILQYIFFETLSVCIEGSLSDGQRVSKEAIFIAISDKVKTLLLASENTDSMVNTRLEDLCSRSVLACFERFVHQVQFDFNQSEFFYSENGEVVLEGVIRREFILLFELIKRLALTTSGSIFKKNRTALFSKIAILETDDVLATSGKPNRKYFFAESDLSVALGIVHHLVIKGFKILLNKRPVEELGEEQLRINFELLSRVDQTQINWFELNPRFFLMGQQVDPENILRLGTGGVIEYENRFYLIPKKQLPSIRLLEEFWKKLQKSKEDSDRKKGSTAYYQLPRSQTLFLLALRNAGIPFKGDDAWKKLCAFYDRLGEQTRTLDLPSSLNVQLKDYQNIGVQWLSDLYELRLGALLADDMGLGKTIQTLSFLERLRARQEMEIVLIVVPSSLVFNWCNEMEKFTPDMPHLIFSRDQSDLVQRLAKNKAHQIVIITYGLMLEHADFLAKIQWNIVVFDEAQNLKNIHAKRTTAARSLSARFKIALTGTPLENHFGEFYSILDTLVPGSLGPLADFRRQFVNSPVLAYELVQDLKLRIKPLILRRAKKDILAQLPEKQETTLSIVFEEQQKDIYRDVALSFNNRVQEAMADQGAAKAQLQMFTALLRLRQVCSDPSALPEITYEKTPPKLETLTQSLKEIIQTGESALVFTQFLQTLQHTSKLLTAAEIPHFILHGGVSVSKRQKIISEFSQSADSAVLLMTLKTGGVGLNLTKASYVFHIEPWWNPAVENQATDRAHRMGQTKPVHVFKYIMHESLEEKMELLKDRKEKQFESLFSDSESDRISAENQRSISKEDFDRLIEIE